MTSYQKIVAFSIALALLLVILELVRRRTMRIEYSWLWIVAVVGLMSLILSSTLLMGLTEWVGAVTPTTTVSIFAFVFLVLICIHFSVKISQLTNQVKKLAQQLAILEAEKLNLERDVRQADPETTDEERKQREADEAGLRA